MSCVACCALLLSRSSFAKSKEECLELLSRLCFLYIVWVWQGDDLNRVQGRHDIYRWLIAAHFLNHRSLSQHLGQFSEDDLVGSGVLSREEATIVMREAEEGSFDEEAVGEGNT